MRWLKAATWKEVSSMADITTDRENTTGTGMGDESTNRRRLDEEELV